MHAPERNRFSRKTSRVSLYSKVTLMFSFCDSMISLLPLVEWTKNGLISFMPRRLDAVVIGNCKWRQFFHFSHFQWRQFFQNENMLAFYSESSLRKLWWIFNDLQNLQVIAIFPFGQNEIMLALLVFTGVRQLCWNFNALQKLPVTAIFPFCKNAGLKYRSQS